MLGTTRNGASVWLGTGMAIFAVALTGCGGSKKTSTRQQSALATAGVTTSTTGGVTSGTTGGGTIGVGTTIPGGGGTTIPGGGGTLPGGGGTLPGGGGTLPGGGGTLPGGGGTTPGGGGTTPPPAGVNDDHGNDTASATAYSIGIVLPGLIQYAGDQDWFRIDLTAGSNYRFETKNLSGGMDSILRLIGPNGAVIQENDDLAAGDPASRIDYTSTADDTYYLAVLHKNPLATAGGFDMEALELDDHGDTHTSATPLTVGTPANGAFQRQSDLDYFSIVLAPGSYAFETSNLNGADTTLRLFDTNGTSELDFDDDGGTQSLASRIDYTITVAGTYFIQVANYAGGGVGGTWTLTATGGSGGGGTTPPPAPADDHLNDMTTTSVLTLNQAMNGSVEVAGDVDWFKVDLAAGQTYELRTDTTGDTILRLIDTDGTTQLAMNDDDPNGGLNSRIDYPITVAGTYYLEVKGFSSATPTYTVTAIGSAAPPPPPPPPPPPATQASLTGAEFADVDGSYGASQGDTITLTFSEAVSIILPAIFPPPVLDPATDFDLLVAGDSFGTGASWVIDQADPTKIVITLGQGAALKLSGTFDPARTTAGAASGVAAKASTTISTASSGLAIVTGQAHDVASTLTTGFQPSASLVQARGLHAAVTLDDGRVLVTGGLDATANGLAFTGRSEVYDPVTNTWTQTDTLAGTAGHMLFVSGQNAYIVGRFSHTATKLPNGNVLVAGGFGYERLDPAQTTPTAIYEELQSAFIFDPTTNSFAATTSPLNVPRESHYATVLPNGQVLISGGYNSAVNQGQGSTLPFVELFDPAQGTFTLLQGNDMVLPRESGSAHLVGGQVVHVGGMIYQGANAYMAAGTETFDPATNLSAQGPALVEDRRFHTAQVLGADVLVLGGASASATLTSVERLSNGVFTKVGDLAVARSLAQSAFVGGDVLVTGGATIDYTANALTEPTTAELYNVAGNVTESYQQQSPRRSHAAVRLADGRVLLIGGYAGGTDLRGTDGVSVPACEVFVNP